MTARIRLAVAVALGLLSSALLPACDMCQAERDMVEWQCASGDAGACQQLQTLAACGG